MERFTVAATQVEVRHLDVEHNLETHVRLIAETADAGCDLVVFPETSVTGNNGSAEVTRFAEKRDRRIMLAHTELGAGDQWIAVELDPALIDRARENPWFALKKRRPETYGELVAQQ